MTDSSQIFIDANIFLRFFIFDKTNPKLSNNSKKIFKRIEENKVEVYTNVLIIAEIVYVLEKYYSLSKADVAEKIHAVLSYDGVKIDHKDFMISALFLHSEKNIDFEDAYSYFDMLNHGIEKIFSFDKKHFSRLKGVNIAV